MKKILANDGISKSGIKILEKSGFKVITEKVFQEDLKKFINKEKIEVLLVRSATKVDEELIDNCPNLKIVGRGGVGMDNINLKHAKKKGIQVFNTPAASAETFSDVVRLSPVAVDPWIVPLAPGLITIPGLAVKNASLTVIDDPVNRDNTSIFEILAISAADKATAAVSNVNVSVPAPPSTVS